MVQAGHFYDAWPNGRPQYRLAATLANSDGAGTCYVWVKR